MNVAVGWVCEFEMGWWEGVAGRDVAGWREVDEGEGGRVGG